MIMNLNPFSKKKEQSKPDNGYVDFSSKNVDGYNLFVSEWDKHCRHAMVSQSGLDYLQCMYQKYISIKNDKVPTFLASDIARWYVNGFTRFYKKCKDKKQEDIERMLNNEKITDDLNRGGWYDEKIKDITLRFGHREGILFYMAEKQMTLNVKSEETKLYNEIQPSINVCVTVSDNVIDAKPIEQEENNKNATQTSDFTHMVIPNVKSEETKQYYKENCNDNVDVPKQNENTAQNDKSAEQNENNQNANCVPDFSHMKSFDVPDKIKIEGNQELYDYLIDDEVIVNCDRNFFEDCVIHAYFKPLWETGKKNKLKVLIMALKPAMKNDWFDKVAESVQQPGKSLKETQKNIKSTRLTIGKSKATDNIIMNYKMDKHGKYNIYAMYKKELEKRIYAS